MQLLVILSPILGTPEIAVVMWLFCPLLGPSEVRVHVATFDFFLVLCATPRNVGVA